MSIWIITTVDCDDIEITREIHLDVRTSRDWFVAEFRHRGVHLSVVDDSESGAAKQLLDKLIDIFRGMSKVPLRDFTESGKKYRSVLQEHFQHKKTPPLQK